MNEPASPAPAPLPTRTSGLAIASLVLGILGTGIPAIITGHMARGRIKRSPELGGAGLALAGLILGYITTVLLGIALLLGIAIGFSGGLAETARAQAAVAKLHEIEAKLEVYRMMGGSYPTTAQGLEALVEQPDQDPVPRRWEQQFSGLPIDPWGSGYIYRLDTAEDSFAVFSMGPDGVEGTGDDLDTSSTP